MDNALKVPKEVQEFKEAYETYADLRSARGLEAPSGDEIRRAMERLRSARSEVKNIGVSPLLHEAWCNKMQAALRRLEDEDNHHSTKKLHYEVQMYNELLGYTRVTWVGRKYGE